MRQNPPTDPADAPADFEPRPYYLLIDGRFRVPISVFVELKPRRPARPVTIELAPTGPGVRRCWLGVGPGTCLGRHPGEWDRFMEFPSEGHARAAGYMPIEPRYVGPSWESYLGAFRPQGERPPKVVLGRPAGR